ncbi:hypothetical protein QF046_000345 [Microbacterium sp. W4I4]|nr:hypothetical protein [Microbacterium sp. W4I4]
MPRENETPSMQAADADRMDQEREVLVDAPDPEEAMTPPQPDGVEADPADVLDQSIEGPRGRRARSPRRMTAQRTRRSCARSSRCSSTGPERSPLCSCSLVTHSRTPGSRRAVSREYSTGT